MRAIAAMGHFVRYFVAACVTGIAVAILPIVSIFMLAGLIALFLLLVWIAFFCGAPLDGGIIQAIFWFVVAPLSLLLSVVIFVLSTLLLSGIFTLVCVLPVSLLTELVCWQGSVRSVIGRLASFLAAGLTLGALMIGIVALLDIQASPYAVVAIALALSLSSGFSTFLFGLVLTLMAATMGGVASMRRSMFA